MCEVIEAENLLVTYFAKHQKNKVSICRLKALRAQIEQSLEDPVYVDITRSSLVKAIELNAGVIEWKGAFVFWLQPSLKARKRAELEESCNWRIPARIRSKFEQVVAAS